MKTEATTKEVKRVIVAQKDGEKRGHYFRPNIKIVLKNKRGRARRSRARGRRR